MPGPIAQRLRAQIAGFIPQSTGWLCFVLAVQCGLVENAFSFCLAQNQAPIPHSESNVVLVPTLVKTKSGEVVYGLSAHDFIVEDDGVEQSVELDDEPQSSPISVVVAVQQGRAAALILEKSVLSGLGTMLESYVGDRRASMAVVALDSHAQLFQDFTDDIPSVTEKLKSLKPGDDGAVILDALLYSIDLFDRRPVGDRRVLILNQRDSRPREPYCYGWKGAATPR